jgi:hypothetical protein
MAVLAGTDFFTVEVLSWRGLVTYYVLFFLRLETRRVTLGGITRHPTEDWITQMARNASADSCGTTAGPLEYFDHTGILQASIVWCKHPGKRGNRGML